jgi:hypothetical protein
LLAAASLRKPLRNITVSSASASKLIWRANTEPSRLVLLICAFSQRKSSAVTQRTPFSSCPDVGGRITLAIAKTVGAMSVGMTWSRIATPRVIWM